MSVETTFTSLCQPFTTKLTAPTLPPTQVGGGVAQGMVTLINTGLEGPVGPSGASASSYQHNQPAPSDTWIINHNLGTKPATNAYSVGGRFMLADIQHINDNQVQINFDGPVSGYAVCS